MIVRVLYSLVFSLVAYLTQIKVCRHLLVEGVQKSVVTGQVQTAVAFAGCAKREVAFLLSRRGWDAL